MLSGWMLYCLLVSGLLLAAGILLEQAARRLQLPQRCIWAGVLAASVLLPFLAPERSEPAAAAADAAIVLDEVTALSPLGVSGEVGMDWAGILAFLPSLEPILLGVWVGASAVLVMLALLATVRLRRAMRGWDEARLEGRHILVSEATGPAVVGLLGGAIVLPRWAMDGDSDLCGLMLAHEEEHLHAHDPMLLHLAAALVVLLPWNLPLWWQLRRLKLAVEVDCDARVLGRGLDLRSYATLLLEVGRRRAGLDQALIAFAEPASFLERRIRIMTGDRSRRGWLLAAGCTAVSAALVAGACAVERPADEAVPEPPVTGPQGLLDSDRPGPAEGPADTVELEGGVIVADSIRGDDPAFARMQTEVGAEVAAPGSEPTFSPRDVEPSLQNVQEFTRALEEAYPTVLKNAGIGGRVLLWVRIGEAGEVTDVRVYESSGHEQLDEAAMRVMRSAEFSPAELDGRPVAVWIALPVTMQTTPDARSGAQREPPPPAGADAERDDDGPGQYTGPLSEQPAFTPREVEPALQNAAGFTRALERAYPLALKNAGIGGRVLLWVFVDEQGRVRNVRVYESSGHGQLDEAAITTMRTAEFSPALNRGERVPVWVALPVTFATTTR